MQQMTEPHATIRMGDCVSIPPISRNQGLITRRLPPVLPTHGETLQPEGCFDLQQLEIVAQWESERGAVKAEMARVELWKIWLSSVQAVSLHGRTTSRMCDQ